jgi:hypothetical protein
MSVTIKVYYRRISLMYSETWQTARAQSGRRRKDSPERRDRPKTPTPLARYTMSMYACGQLDLSGASMHLPARPGGAFRIYQMVNGRIRPLGGEYAAYEGARGRLHPQRTARQDVQLTDPISTARKDATDR